MRAGMFVFEKIKIIGFLILEIFSLRGGMTLMFEI